MASGLVVITGGPGSGKTSLVDYLASLGYATVPEAGIQIIDERNQALGVPGQIAWRKRHPRLFQWLIIERQVALDNACRLLPGQVGFCDRGRPDALAYAKLSGIELDDDLRALVLGQSYLRVFLLDTFSRFEERPATGRTSDRQRSLRIRQLLEETYRSLGYTPVPVPELSIEERARLVLSELGLLDP